MNLQICTNVIKKGWQVVRDRKGRIGPYAYLRDQWVSFDDIGMIRHKSEYIKAMGLGGGMIWALDLDDFKNICGCEEYPLLRTINRVLRGYKKSDPKCVLGKSKKPPSTTPKPTMMTNIPSTSTPKTTLSYEEIVPSYEIEETDNTLQEGGESNSNKPCKGQIFAPHESQCNMYYQCNQGVLQQQTCSSGLFWSEDHCDWPENSQCHPDGERIRQLISRILSTYIYR